MGIDDKVIEVIAHHLGLNIDRVTKEAYIVSDLGADSLDMIELIMAMEDKFNIAIPDEEAELVITVQDVIDIISKKYNQVCP